MVETKTNKVICPYVIKRPNDFKYDSLKSFTKAKEVENFKDIYCDRNYTVSLAFELQEDDLLYFSLIKKDKNNITIIDEEEKTEHKNYLKAKQKVKQWSLFVIIPKWNILLSLYNHNAFGNSVPTLRRYLYESLGIELTFDPLPKHKDINELKKRMGQVKHIHFITASQNFKDFERDNKNLPPRKRLRKYIEVKEEILKVQRVTGLTIQEIWRLITEKQQLEDYNKIIVDGTNVGEVDILDEWFEEYHCNVEADTDNLSKLDDFKKAIKFIISQNEPRLKSFNI